MLININGKHDSISLAIPTHFDCCKHIPFVISTQSINERLRNHFI